MGNLVLPDQEDKQDRRDLRAQVDLQGSVVSPDLRELKDQEENQVQMAHLVCDDFSTVTFVFC